MKEKKKLPTISNDNQNDSIPIQDVINHPFLLLTAVAFPNFVIAYFIGDIIKTA